MPGDGPERPVGSGGAVVRTDQKDEASDKVLGLGEVQDHPHNRERNLLIADADDKLEPAPAPRLSRTPGSVRRPIPKVGQHTDEVLSEYGFASADIAALRQAGAVG